LKLSARFSVIRVRVRYWTGTFGRSSRSSTIKLSLDCFLGLGAFREREVVTLERAVHVGFGGKVLEKLEGVHVLCFVTKASRGGGAGEVRLYRGDLTKHKETVVTGNLVCV
jgi:hypothetical protein